MFARKLQHPKQNIRKKGKLIWEQAISYRYLHIVLNRPHIALYECIYFYANYSLEIEQQVKQREARTINKLSNVHFFFVFF